MNAINAQRAFEREEKKHTIFYSFHSTQIYFSMKKIRHLNVSIIHGPVSWFNKVNVLFFLTSNGLSFSNIL